MNLIEQFNFRHTTGLQSKLTVFWWKEVEQNIDRNEFIQIVLEESIEFGIASRWNYLESGHGKGPCDGLDASVKRMADIAVKQQKCLIQDANDFYEWAISRADESKVKYIRYTEEDL